MGLPAPPLVCVCVPARRRRGRETEERNERRNETKRCLKSTHPCCLSSKERLLFPRVSHPSRSSRSSRSFCIFSILSSHYQPPRGAATSLPPQTPSRRPTRPAALQLALDIGMLVIARPASVRPDMAHGFPNVAVERKKISVLAKAAHTHAEILLLFSSFSVFMFLQPRRDHSAHCPLLRVVSRCVDLEISG
jgi:hypothetical protein